MDYLIRIDPEYGGVSQLMTLVWLGVFFTGIMLLRGQPPSNPVRAAFRRRTALGAVIFGGVGIVQLLLRVVENQIGTPYDDTIPALDFRLWSYLILLAGLVFLGFSVRYWRTRYRQEVAASKQMRVVKPTQQRRAQPNKVAPANNATVESEPRPVATTSRREARRDRKRRGR